MVEAARLEDGNLELRLKPVNLRDLITRSLEAVDLQATPDHHIRFDDRSRGRATVMGDPLRLEIIIGNLLDNAIKYSPEGGDIECQLSTAGGIALVSVRDHGIGIAPGDMGRLLVRFSRLATAELDVPGTGLGLYLAASWRDVTTGDINAVSKLGEGSEFTLSLPIESPAR